MWQGTRRGITTSLCVALLGRSSLCGTLLDEGWWNVERGEEGTNYRNIYGNSFLYCLNTVLNYTHTIFYYNTYHMQKMDK